MEILLSKSDYKIACSCPQKLRYKKKGYPSTAEENEFQKMLAEGGYVVGKIAQLLYPGVLINARDLQESAKLTHELLGRETVTIHEATFIAGQMIIRVDILKKVGNSFQLIEVKSKSFRSSNPEEFKKRDKTGQLNGRTRDYIKDVIYQAMVLQEVYPAATIQAYLLLPDKDSVSSVDDLPSWFATDIKEPARSGGFRTVTVTPKEDGLTSVVKSMKDDGFLQLLDVTEEVKVFGKDVLAEASDYLELVNSNFDNYLPILTKECKKCEFTSSQASDNGFDECWGDLATVQPKIWDLYQAGRLKNDFVNVKISGRRVGFDELANVEFGAGALDARRAIQYENTLKNTEYPSGNADLKLFAAELRDQFQFPLHFVDFETMSSAIPFHKGLNPYSMFPFQWSVHTVHEPGAEPIHSEFLNTETGYPGFRFAKSLMKAIGSTGTPLMWSTHENTALKNVLKHMGQLGYNDVELREWLLDITKEKDPKGKVIRPGRFVDMNDFALKNYFHPEMKGRTSIKVTLPAIWKNFDYLHNIAWFKPWVHKEDGKILDPYQKLKLEVLPELWGFQINAIDEESEETFEFSDDSYEVKDGGAAMKAYQDMIFSIDIKRKQQLGLQLRKYCELDTLAMVIIYTHWENITNQA